ncbi:cytochrome P450 [Streptosporangium canum]|uniref:cytochrome P450 n=1 Tax=Streptosporangium canum TaxID=324952 RepID=UPI0037A0C13A
MSPLPSPESSATCPVAHPLDQGPDGVNRPGLYKNAQYHALRETGTGVVEIIRANGTPGKLVTRYDDVKKVLRQDGCSREAALDVDDVGLEGTLLGLDGDNHAAVRNVVKDWFTPQAIEKRRGEIENRAAMQLKAMLDQGEPVDLMATFAIPLTLETISDMLGLPQPDRLQFRQWGEAFLANSDLTRADTDASALAMAGYLATLIEQRRQEPAADLLSQIAVGGAHLPPDRLLMLPIALVLGGWEATASSIGTFTQVLLTHPYAEHESAYAYLIDHPEMIPGAVTELERMFSTSAGDDMPRRVIRQMRLPSGAHLQPGEVVIPSHDAANFDPRVFPDPHRIDFARSPNKHLSFGHGPHHCIGRHLGHLEVEVAIGLLIRELPTLRLAISSQDIQYKAGHAVSGPIRLPVAWS